MKKFKTLLLLLIAFSFVATLFAEDPAPKQQAAGLTSYGAETIDTLNASGLIKLNGTTIRTLAQVRGSLLATSARLSSLEVYGEANLNNTTLSQPSTIIGYLRAQNSNFPSLLTLGAQKATFTACKLSSLTIRKDDSFKGKQIIELKQGTEVTGPITFESGKGEVHVYSTSHVYQPITGGKLIKKN